MKHLIMLNLCGSHGGFCFKRFRLFVFLSFQGDFNCFIILPIFKKRNTQRQISEKNGVIIPVYFF